MILFPVHLAAGLTLILAFLPSSKSWFYKQPVPVIFVVAGWAGFLGTFAAGHLGRAGQEQQARDRAMALVEVARDQIALSLDGGNAGDRKGWIKPVEELLRQPGLSLELSPVGLKALNQGLASLEVMDGPDSSARRIRRWETAVMMRSFLTIESEYLKGNLRSADMESLVESVRRQFQHSPL
jgi:hypothetical protein